MHWCFLLGLLDIAWGLYVHISRPSISSLSIYVYEFFVCRIHFALIYIYFCVLTYFLKLMFRFGLLADNIRRFFLFLTTSVQYDKECNCLHLNDILWDWDMKHDHICLSFYLQIKLHRKKVCTFNSIYFFLFSIFKICIFLFFMFSYFSILL